MKEEKFLDDVTNRLVFVNGQPVNSLSRGSRIPATLEMKEKGAFLSLPKGTLLKEPLYLYFFSDSERDYQNQIAVGEASEVAVVESYFGNTHVTTEMTIGPGGIVDHYKIQREGQFAQGKNHIGSLRVRQDSGSRLTSHSIALGGGTSRTDIATELVGEGTESILNGLYLASDHQRVEHHTTIDHVKPHSVSAELYKGILGGKAQGIFDGKIIVRPAAQKVSARQTNRNLLLSDDVVIDTQPILEIHANDVKCHHGATIGRLDEKALFYLRSRGIDEGEAKRLLTFAFASEMLDKIAVPFLKERLKESLHSFLQEEIP